MQSLDVTSSPMTTETTTIAELSAQLRGARAEIKRVCQERDEKALIIQARDEKIVKLEAALASAERRALQAAGNALRAGTYNRAF